MNDEQLSRALRLISKERHTVKETADILGISIEELLEGMAGLNVPEPTTKWGKLREKIQRHSTVILSVNSFAMGIIGSACAIAAAVYAQKVRDLEAELADWEGNEANSWPTIKVHPETMEAVRNGATLKYRERRFGKNHLRTQMTTNDDFSAFANEKFNEDPTDD